MSKQDWVFKVEFSSVFLFQYLSELGRTYGFQFLNKGKIENFCFNVCFLDTVTNTVN